MFFRAHLFLEALFQEEACIPQPPSHHLWPKGMSQGRGVGLFVLQPLPVGGIWFAPLFYRPLIPRRIYSGVGVYRSLPSTHPCDNRAQASKCAQLASSPACMDLLRGTLVSREKGSGIPQIEGLASGQIWETSETLGSPGSFQNEVWLTLSGMQRLSLTHPNAGETTSHETREGSPRQRSPNDENISITRLLTSAGHGTQCRSI